MLRAVLLSAQQLEHWTSQLATDKSSNVVSVPQSDGQPLLNLSTGDTRADFRCYNPNNMQTRALACPVGAWLAPHWCFQSRQCADWRSPPPLSVALRSLEQARFVGLVEHYAASLCLLHHRVVGGERFRAERVRRAVTNQSRITHGVGVPHDAVALDHATLALIDRLTGTDRQLYVAAKSRFLAELDASHQCRVWLSRTSKRGQRT